jgi:hypothetical protein
LLHHRRVMRQIGRGGGIGAIVLRVVCGGRNGGWSAHRDYLDFANV